MEISKYQKRKKKKKKWFFSKDLPSYSRSIEVYSDGFELKMSALLLRNGP